MLMMIEKGRWKEIGVSKGKGLFLSFFRIWNEDITDFHLRNEMSKMGREKWRHGEETMDDDEDDDKFSGRSFQKLPEVKLKTVFIRKST